MIIWNLFRIMYIFLSLTFLYWILQVCKKIFLQTLCLQNGRHRKGKEWYWRTWGRRRSRYDYTLRNPVLCFMCFRFSPCFYCTFWTQFLLPKTYYVCCVDCRKAKSYFTNCPLLKKELYVKTRTYNYTVLTGKIRTEMTDWNLCFFIVTYGLLMTELARHGFLCKFQVKGKRSMGRFQMKQLRVSRKLLLS